MGSTRELSLAAALIAGTFSTMSAAADAGSGTLSPTNPSLTFTAGPFTLTNNSYQLPTGSTCSPEPFFRCDFYHLTVDVPADYVTAHPRDVIHMTMTWPNHDEDIDFYVFDAKGSDISGGQGGSVADPELIDLPVAAGTYDIQVFPYDTSGGTATITIDLITLPEAGSANIPPQATGLLPLHAVHLSPDGIADDAGEPSVGYNAATGRAMFIAGTSTLRITFPEKLPQPMPEVCDALWEDVSGIYTSLITLDPILFTDQSTGRTFVSQLNASLALVLSSPVDTGFNSLFGYTDDDGDTWLPGQIALPDSGYDHQTVGSGPWHEPAPPLASFPSAVYYCSQSGNPAFCSRSDDGGVTFNPSVSVYSGGVGERCAGLHGHIRVAPDGTVYLPSNSCDHKQGITLSVDNGETWTSRVVPDSTEGLSDPQMALASDGTGYFCYSDSEGHLKVAVTRDQGESWSASQDVGMLAGVRNAVFAQAIAGDPDRAACAFIGTSEPGDRESEDFPGIWYPYVAMTYDNGQTWHVTNISPNDPVQREGGIWLHGGGNDNRNLLDFNEITLDERGRVIFGYADGCIDECVQGPPNTFSANGVVSRQVGGRSLYAQYDPAPDTVPAAACLTGESGNDGKVAQLSWREPPAGGSAIQRYRIYRSEGTGAPVLLAETDDPQPKYADARGENGTHRYTYIVKAVNAGGEGLASNPVTLDLVGTGVLPPILPPTPQPTQTATESRFGGALAPGLLLLLAVGGWLRRRRL